MLYVHRKKKQSKLLFHNKSSPDIHHDDDGRLRFLNMTTDSVLGALLGSSYDVSAIKVILILLRHFHAYVEPREL